MLKKNCHQVLRSQKTKLTPLELIFQTAGAINPHKYLMEAFKKIYMLHFTQTS